MTNNYIYQVAGFRFSVQVPAGLDIQTLLPSFRAFRCEEEGGDLLFSLEAHHASLPEDATAVLWEESANDMGFSRLLKTAGGYRVMLRYTEQGATHVMRTDRRKLCVQRRLRFPDDLVL